MSDDLQYEDDLIEQLNNLPFPDEDGAWEDMKKLLDEGGNKKAVPPPYLKYRVWGGVLAVALLIVMLCLFLGRQDTAEKKEKNGITNNNEQPANNRKGKGDNVTDTANAADSAPVGGLRDSANTVKSGTPASKDSSKVQTEKRNPGDRTKPNGKSIEPADEAGDNTEQRNGGTRKPLKNQSPVARGAAKPGVNNGRQPFAGKGNKPASETSGENPGLARGKTGYKPARGEKIATVDTSAQNSRVAGSKIVDGNIADKPTAVNETTAAAVGQDKANKPATNTTVEPKQDMQLANGENKKVGGRNDTSASKAAQPALPVIDSAKAATAKTPDAKKSFHVSIGVAEQQAVRLDCHCAYPDNIYSNTPAVKDYIPAVYVRVYPAKKWFMQGGLKIAAPQFVEEQLYKANVQNLPLNYTTTSYVLKKLYYTQIPVSFNYVILPGWSAGIGVMYNGFSQGISQVDVRKKIFGSASDSLISSQIITGRNDSNFTAIVKNNFQGFIESEYRWKYLSFGARYAYSLQPYIRYADPFTGKLVEKKTSAFNFFIRVELWDSKKKKK